MKLYQAGIYAANFTLHSTLYNRLNEAEQKARTYIDYVLESYHYVHKESFVNKIRKDKLKIFLDSGAYSAFTKGVSIDLDGYCRYIKENEDIVEVASVLDDITSADKTYENQKLMEKKGVEAIPCFHYGEDERYLDYYANNYAYIALGGIAAGSKPQLKFWLDRLWEKYLTDGSGKPKTKVHGFGLTTQSLMERYPWYSVDSSRWVKAGSTGGIFVHGYGIVAVSGNSSFTKVDWQHIDNLPEIQSAAIYKVIDKSGFDYSRLRDTYLARWSYNLWSFATLGELMNQHQFIPEQIRMF